MITLDSRIGSNYLLPLLPKGKARLSHLEYGDVSWIGNGPDGVPWLIGVEIKKLMDALSSMTSGRFAGHQLPGLQATYSLFYLLVEGVWRGNPQTGILERPGPRVKGKVVWEPVSLGTRQFMARDLEGWINSQDILGHAHRLKTGSPRETADTLLTLHHWWVDKEWEEHRSHLAFDEGDVASGGGLLTKPSLLRRVAKELPGIGWGRSIAVEQEFESVKDMVGAGMKRWVRIPGIGKTIAERVVKEVNGG